MRTTTLERVHAADITGKLEMFDRMIFRGHLTHFFRDGAFAVFLYACGVLLKDFGPFVERASAAVKAHTPSDWRRRRAVRSSTCRTPAPSARGTPKRIGCGSFQVTGLRARAQSLEHHALVP